MINKYDGNKNAFIYSCENRRVEMLAMMIENFQISSEQKYYYRYNEKLKIEHCTGFINACINSSISVV